MNLLSHIIYSYDWICKAKDRGDKDFFGRMQEKYIICRRIGVENLPEATKKKEEEHLCCSVRL